MEVKIKEAIASSRNNKALKSIGIYTAYLIGGFILGLGEIADGIKPFGVAFVSVSKNKGYIFSFLGAVIANLMLGIDLSFARYLGALFIAGLGAFIIESFELNHIMAFPIGVAIISSLSTGLLINIKSGAQASQYLTLIGECILTAGATYFYYKTINANFRQMRFWAFPIPDLICIIISFTTPVLLLSSINIWLLYPIRIIAIMVVLYSIRFGGERWSIMLSLTLGFMLGAKDKDILFLCGAMGFSALISGMFTQLASLGVSGAYLSCLTFFSIIAGGNAGLSLFLDGMLATLLFILTPSGISEKIEGFFDNGKDLPPDGTLRQNLVLKLRFASSAMSTISDSVDQVRERINEVTRKQNELQRLEMTQEEYITKEIILEKTNQIRMVASDQFISISSMLNDLAQEFSQAEIFDSNSSNKIRRLLGEHEIYPTNISAITDKYGRMRVEILLDSSADSLSNPALQKEIGRICNRYFDVGRITNFKNDTMLSFSEKPNYVLEFGFAQHSAQGELCGDTVKIINDGKGHSILIISDGMGKGSRAALDGAMGAGLLSKLLNAGFGFDSALKVVNSALLVKSNDESLATLDIANIDMFTGKCELFKAGAPASYIIKDKKITKCELSSMPAGILRGIEFAKRTTVLGPSDSIILLSDGITDIGERWLKDILSSLPTNPQEAADYILKSALEEMKDCKIDDMSVIYARLERN